MTRTLFAAALLVAASATAHAAPVVYEIDAKHTYPSFEADHMGGMSTWRGKFNRTSGTVMLDKVAQQGSVDVTVDIASVDFGLDTMNEHAVDKTILDAAQFPTATYKGKLDGFSNGAPLRVVGELTLHGVTKPLTLDIKTFKCMQHPKLKRDFCGADALGTFQRDAFGIDTGKAYGFSMDVTVRIQIEAVAKE